MDRASAGTDPLAQPTARRLLEALAQAKRPLPTVELAELIDVHPNSARLHLSRLLEVGMVESGTAHGNRGRPRKTWTVAAGTTVEGPLDIYRELAGWLGRSVAVLAADPAEIRGQGRRIGREIAADAESEDSPQVLETSLRSMGFQPVREEISGSRTRMTLRNCPYRDVAESNAEVICTLHLGIAEGVVQGANCCARVTSFKPENPHVAGCMIEIESPATDPRTEVPG